jgi:hypothetical protein
MLISSGLRVTLGENQKSEDAQSVKAKSRVDI